MSRKLNFHALHFFELFFLQCIAYLLSLMTLKKKTWLQKIEFILDFTKPHTMKSIHTGLNICRKLVLSFRNKLRKAYAWNTGITVHNEASFTSSLTEFQPRKKSKEKSTPSSSIEISAAHIDAPNALWRNILWSDETKMREHCANSQAWWWCHALARFCCKMSHKGSCNMDPLFFNL